MKTQPVYKTPAWTWTLLFLIFFSAALALYASVLDTPFGGTEYQTFLQPLQERSVPVGEFIAYRSPLAVHEVKFTRPLLKLLPGVALAERAAGFPRWPAVLGLSLLLAFIGLQARTTARETLDRAVELEVTERLMAAMGEKERLMEDGASYLLRLEGVERDIRIRDQSKIINVYFRHLRGPEGPAIRRNPRKLPPNAPVLRWDGINLDILPASAEKPQTVQKY